jgi:malic enzyme
VFRVQRVVVFGAGTAGVVTAEQLRALDDAHRHLGAGRRVH